MSAELLSRLGLSESRRREKHLREHHLEMVGKFQEKIAALEDERDALKSEVESLKKHAESLNEKMFFWHGEENKRSAEFFALKKRLDKGVRVGVYDGDSGLSVTFTENKLCNKFNAILIIDDGVEL